MESGFLKRNRSFKGKDGKKRSKGCKEDREGEKKEQAWMQSSRGGGARKRGGNNKMSQEARHAGGGWWWWRVYSHVKPF